jgi:hypothetical protein
MLPLHHRAVGAATTAQWSHGRGGCVWVPPPGLEPGRHLDGPASRAGVSAHSTTEARYAGTFRWRPALTRWCLPSPCDGEGQGVRSGGTRGGTRTRNTFRSSASEADAFASLATRVSAAPFGWGSRSAGQDSNLHTQGARFYRALSSPMHACRKSGPSRLSGRSRVGSGSGTRTRLGLRMRQARRPRLPPRNGHQSEDLNPHRAVLETAMLPLQQTGMRGQLSPWPPGATHFLRSLFPCEGAHLPARIPPRAVRVTRRVVPPAGLEPATHRLRGDCSAIEPERRAQYVRDGIMISL